MAITLITRIPAPVCVSVDCFELRGYRRLKPGSCTIKPPSNAHTGRVYCHRFQKLTIKSERPSLMFTRVWTLCGTWQIIGDPPKEFLS